MHTRRILLGFLDEGDCFKFPIDPDEWVILKKVRLNIRINSDGNQTFTQKFVLGNLSKGTTHCDLSDTYVDQLLNLEWARTKEAFIPFVIYIT